MPSWDTFAEHEFLEALQRSDKLILLRIGNNDDMYTQSCDETLEKMIQNLELPVELVRIDLKLQPDIAALYPVEEVPALLAAWRGIIIWGILLEKIPPPMLIPELYQLCQAVKNNPDIVEGILQLQYDCASITLHGGRDAILLAEDNTESGTCDLLSNIDPPLKNREYVSLLGHWQDNEHFIFRFLSRGKFSQQNPA